MKSLQSVLYLVPTLLAVGVTLSIALSAGETVASGSFDDGYAPAQAATDTPTSISPTDTPTSIPPTDTPTSIPPTDTPTSIPPTDTPTSIPPTDTPTSIPPTDTPTSIPPTDTPTSIPPTDTATPVPNAISLAGSSGSSAPPSGLMVFAIAGVVVLAVLSAGAAIALSRARSK